MFLFIYGTITMYIEHNNKHEIGMKRAYLQDRRRVQFKQ